MSETQRPAAGQRWLKRKEAAARLGVSENTLAKRAMSGDGPPFVKMGKARQAHVRYLESDLTAWLDAQKRTSTSDTGATTAA